MTALPRAASETPRLTLAFLCAILFLDTMGVGLILPVTPQLIEEISPHHASDAAAINGYLLTTFALMNFFCAPLLGGASDRFGRRPVLLISLLGFGLDYFIMAASQSLETLFIARVISGGFGATIAAVAASIVDLSDKDNRARNFGYMGLAIGLGFIFGPVIGGVVGEFGPRLPFILAGFMALFACLFGLVYLKETLPVGLRRPFSLARANPLGSILSISKNTSVFPIFLSVFVIQVANQSFASIWAFYTIEVAAWTPIYVGLSIGIYGLALAIVQGVLTGPVVQRFGEPSAAYFSMAAGLLAYLGLAAAGSGFSIYVWIIVGGLAGFSYPAMQSMMTSNVADDSQGELQGAIVSSGSIAAIVGPLIMTQVFVWFTNNRTPAFPGAPFLLAALLILIAVALFSLATKKLRTESA